MTHSPPRAAKPNRSVLAIIALAILVPTFTDAQECLPDGVSAEDWQAVCSAYEAGLHFAVATEDGYEARNPEQSWDVSFDGRGFTVTPEEKHWSWGLELVRYGFANNEIKLPERAALSAENERISQRWDERLEEWYINDTRGIEHGFTVDERPGNGETAKNSLLSFSFFVRGELQASIDGSGRDIQFLNQNREVALTYSGLTVFDSNGRPLPARFEASQEGLTLLVDERNASYPITIDPIAERAYLKASNSNNFDGFGRSVAMWGDTLVVGAGGEDSNATGVNRDENDNSALESGAAYVFVRSGSTWIQEAYLKASNTDSLDGFGWSVAISGDTVIVGSIFERSGATGVDGDQLDDSAPGSGAAYVFVRSGTTWVQEAYLKASNTGGAGGISNGDNFGSSVDVCGDTAIVGAVYEESNATGVDGDQTDNSASASGAAYVFTRSGSFWSQQAYLKASNTEFFDSFGASVAISEDTIVVGASNESSSASGVGGDQSDNSVFASGAAFVFVRSGSTWSQEAYLKASNPMGVASFGNKLDILEDTIVVGAPGESSNATGVNGDEEDTSSLAAGSAYVFEREGSSWSQTAYLKATTTTAADYFGDAVAVSNDMIIVGARYADSDDSFSGQGGGTGPVQDALAGDAYVFVRNESTWLQQGNLREASTDSFDTFGFAVAAFGDTAVIGAPFEDGASSGVGGDPSDNNGMDSGSVYAYQILPALLSDTTSISLSLGGQQDLALDGGTQQAGWFYFVLGSATGTTPGLNLGGGLTLPVNIDAYFSLSLNRPNLSAFGNFAGQLDSVGKANASLTVVAGTDPALAGVTLSHAYLSASVFGIPEFASNAVSVSLIP